ncbi:MAG: response regulator transcription factor [Chromatiales bacterium]|jgi:two-component system response regulator DegU
MDLLLSAGQDALPADDGNPIEIIVIDDYPVIRHGICSLIGMQRGFEVVGDGSDIHSGLPLIRAKKPHILLLDLELGKQCNSIDLMAELRIASPNTCIVVYTAHDRENLVLKAIRCGARAYVLKSSYVERLFEAIRVVASGGSYLDPGITSFVMNKVGLQVGQASSYGEELTKRELEVLGELVSGKRNREIADGLFISERTVKFHIKSMFGKLKAKTRTEVVNIAIKKGFV